MKQLNEIGLNRKSNFCFNILVLDTLEFKRSFATQFGF